MLPAIRRDGPTARLVDAEHVLDRLDLDLSVEEVPALKRVTRQTIPMIPSGGQDRRNGDHWRSAQAVRSSVREIRAQGNDINRISRAALGQGGLGHGGAGHSSTEMVP